MAKKRTTDDTSAPAAPRAPRRAAIKKQAPLPAVPATANASATASPTTPSGGTNGRPEPTQAEIAEAAYFRHLNRGGAGGDEFTDWIEAERELRKR